jgi:flagellar export protein FliJ
MAFRFSLEPVLRLRASYERLERQRLLAIAAMRVRVREEIGAAAREEAAARHARKQMLSSGIAAAEIQLGVSAEQARARRNRELFDRLAALERQHGKQSRIYQAARRMREVMQSLRERKLREYQREQDRKTQQLIDELYLLRRGRPLELE